MKKNGFTLVELAIVLVIVGLLVVGIFAGQDLIKQAKYISVINKLKDSTTGHFAFKGKFGQIPGDIKTAIEFGLCKDSAGVDNCALTQSGSSLGNGNGDGVILGYTGVPSATQSYDGEIANYWVHLSNGNFIKGGFSQISGCTFGLGFNCRAVAGENFPKAAIGGGIGAMQTPSSPSQWFPAGLHYTLGATESYNLGDLQYMAGYNPLYGPGGVPWKIPSMAGRTLMPEDAYYFDKKLDDGLPRSGKVAVFSSYGQGAAYSGASPTPYFNLFGGDTDDLTLCHSLDASSVSQYNLSLKVKTCSIRIYVDE